MNVYVAPSGNVVIENATVSELHSLYDALLEIKDTAKAENILPRPVIRDGNGKLTKDYMLRDWYLKLQEEIFESVDTIFRNAFEWELGRSYSATDDEVAEEIADVITVCISYLNARGYDEKKRSEIFAKVNEKNGKRGYFKE